MQNAILATLCYVRHEGKTLMLHRNKQADDIHEGFYVGLGGKLKPGESPEEGCIREVNEEGNIEIQNPRFRGVLTFANGGRLFNGKPQPDWYVFVYTATRFSGTPKANKEGELEWILDEDVPTLPMHEGDKEFTPWVYGNDFFSGKLRYDGEKLIGIDVRFYG